MRVLGCWNFGDGASGLVLGAGRRWGLGIGVSATKRQGWYLARVGRLIHRWGLVRVSYWRVLVIGKR